MDTRKWKLSPGLRTIRDWSLEAGADLYIVGGWVRDTLLDMPAWDADLSGPLLPERVRELLPEDGRVTLTLRDAGLGTVELHAAGETFEYTAFRRESYRPGGAHRPSRVVLGATLEEDAARRDFRVNAMYLRLKDLALVDPLGGLEDLGDHVLSTTRSPESVLNEDGLRLMRLVRQSAELEFRPDDATWEAARSHAELLGDIAPERLREELVRILTADTRHPEKNYAVSPVVSALTGLAELGTWPYLCPEAAGCASDPRRIRAASQLPPDPALRLAALWQPLDETALGEACRKLRLTTEETRRILRLCPAAARELEGDAFELLCAPLGRADARDLVLLRRALAREGLSPASGDETDRLAKMEARGVPFSLGELAVRGGDLLADLGGPSPAVGAVLHALWRHAILCPEDNDREILLRLAREMEQEC